MERPVATIHIEISGPVQSGKSSVAAAIRQMLKNFGYCVAIPDRAERNNPSASLPDAEPHEKPNLDRTVFIITEKTVHLIEK